MEVLTPHLRVALSLEEFIQGIGSDYPEKFIVQPDGKIFKRTELPYGRFIQYQVDSLPNKGGNKLPALKEEIAFLPCGKVPVRFLHQIIDFFKRVMTDMGGTEVRTHGALEAMAHIVWNPNQPNEYQVRIPTQRVSAASVSYEFDHLEPGDIIVVDIHSHNDMGAFFSGTDDNDDKKNTCYSGVVGKLSSAEPATIWRFNDLNHKKIPCKVEDIFQADSVSCPDSWLEKVQRFGGYRQSYPFSGSGRGNVFPMGRAGISETARGVVSGRNIGNSHLPLVPQYGGRNMHGMPNSAYDDDDDLFSGLGAEFGIGDDDYMVGLAKEAEDMLDQEDLDLGFSGVGVDRSSDEDLIRGMIERGDLRLEDFASVLPRFHLTQVDGVDKWVDKYTEDADGNFEHLDDKEKDIRVESEGEFMMYVPTLDLYIISSDIEENSTPEELWDIFCRAEDSSIPSTAEMNYEIDEARRVAIKEELMKFLKNGTTPMDKTLITGFLYSLHEKGELKPKQKKEKKGNVQVH